MRVRILKWGNSLGLRLSKAMVYEFGLEPGQEMELSIEGGKARLSPVQLPSYRIEDLVAEMKRLGPENQPPDLWTIPWSETE